MTVVREGTDHALAKVGAVQSSSSPSATMKVTSHEDVSKKETKEKAEEKEDTDEEETPSLSLSLSASYDRDVDDDVDDNDNAEGITVQHERNECTHSPERRYKNVGSNEEGKRRKEEEETLLLLHVQKLWKERVAREKKGDGDGVAMEDAFNDVIVRYALDTFYETFWSDFASHPVSDYQKHKINDTNIHLESWSGLKIPARDDDDNVTYGGGRRGDTVVGQGRTAEAAAATRRNATQSYRRIINYMHPSDAPMGPSKVQSRKVQTLTRYGRCGMVLTTETQVEGVPVADCFVLVDTILVEAMPKTSALASASDKGKVRSDHNDNSLDDNGATVRLSARYAIKFVKSTMWKKIVQANAKKGIEKWLRGYMKFVTDNSSRTAMCC